MFANFTIPFTEKTLYVYNTVIFKAVGLIFRLYDLLSTII